jgi:hypothetical protein
MCTQGLSTSFAGLFNEDDEIVAENWVYDVEYTGEEYYQVQNFWWGSE